MPNRAPSLPHTILLAAVAALALATAPACPSRSAPAPAPAPTAADGWAGPGVAFDDVAACTPDCDGRVCGPDGCNGQCGVCGPGEACSGAGQCTPYACTPECDGKACGPDGCGGSCGGCGDGEYCVASTGQCAQTDPCGGVTFEGCCDGETLTWCDSGEIVTLDCAADGFVCGWAVETSDYSCGETSASDPSGAFPRSCSGECTCDSKDCGDDGCGQSCGTCDDGATCLDGACVEDPCGGLSYEGCCAGSVLTYCDAGALAEIDCGGEGCGWVVESGGYDCGNPGVADPDGVFPLACGGDTPCVPNCERAVCGDDGCGGSCGSCGAGEACDAAGQCEDVTSDPCDVIGDIGCCLGTDVYWCEDGALVYAECAAEPSCGWDADNAYYYCGTSGTADPSGTYPLTCPAGIE